MEPTVECLQAVAGLMNRLNVDTHAIEQVRVGLQQEREGFLVRFEQATGVMRVESKTGGGIEFNRIVDIVTRDLFTRVHTEIKTGYESIAHALDIDQVLKDAALAIKNFQDKTGQTLQNVIRFMDHEFGQTVPLSIQNRMRTAIQLVVREGFSFEELKAAIGSFNFVDAVGRVIKTELNEKGEVIFRDAMGVILGKDGTMAQVALSAAKHSPDFSPAMETVFGPSGKLSDAAREAATGANLDPARESLEEKLEQSVKIALDEAGNKAAAHAGKALASKIGEGATALGNIYTAVPQLYSAVEELGEVWDKPLQSTEDYMNLFSKLGGALSQGVQTVQALAGVTKIAAAAQAVFNAVMAMNPIVLIVIAVIALIALIAALVVYWDRVKAAVRDNPWVAAIGVIFGPLGILISLIVLVIAYWDELKLAVLKGANFISIKVQQIGAVFVGLKNLIGMVWDWIVTSVYNFGVGILNTFIEFGARILNFFIDLVNDAIGVYNDVVEYIPGVPYIDKLERVDAEAIKIAKREVPQVDMAAAFAGVGQVTGGLEGQIAKQEEVVRKAKEADEERRRKAREQAAAPAAAPGVPALPAMLPTAGLAAPAVPLAGVGAATRADHSVHVEGGIHVTINAERLEADSAKLLTDEMVQRLQERLDALRMERERRLGTRAAAPA